MMFDMCNKVFFLNFGLGDPNPSTFFGNVQRNIIEQMKNSDFHSIFHFATITVNLFDIFELHSGMHLELE